jgi:LPS sulfotransferase NodH
MNNDNDKYRYMLVGTGRSGSSLLSAILADAGANFDMPNVSAWIEDQEPMNIPS